MLHSPPAGGVGCRHVEPWRRSKTGSAASAPASRPRGCPNGWRTASTPDAVRAFVAARATFIEGARIDMGRLATKLGVDRTSLFRWVGQPRRAALRGPLVARRPDARAGRGRDARHRGRRHAWPPCSRTSSATSSRADYFRGFLQREPARALRLLTTKESEIQRRYVAVVEALVRQELGEHPFGARGDRARPRLPAGPHLGVVHVRGPHQRRPAQRGRGRARPFELVLPARDATPHTRRRSRRAGTTTTSTATSTTPSTTRRWTRRSTSG